MKITVKGLIRAISHLGSHEGHGFRVWQSAGDAAAELPHEAEKTNNDELCQWVNSDLKKGQLNVTK